MIISTQLSGILLSLAAAASWGSSDFSGGFASRRNSSVIVLGISAISGLITLMIFFLLTGEGVQSWLDAFWAAAAGISGGLGLVALYRGLAHGSASIVSPTAAVIGAAVPVLFGALLEGLPSPLQIIGFTAGLGGIWLVSRDSSKPNDEKKRGIGLAMIAGICFGGFYVSLAQVQPGLIFGPLVVTKAIQLVMALLIVWASRLKIAAWRGLPVALLAGVLDAVGNACFLAAENLTRLDVAAVLASMYPAGTVLLSSLVLNEKVPWIKWLGVGLCIAAVALIAA